MVSVPSFFLGLLLEPEVVFWFTKRLATKTPILSQHFFAFSRNLNTAQIHFSPWFALFIPVALPKIGCEAFYYLLFFVGGFLSNSKLVTFEASKPLIFENLEGLVKSKAYVDSLKQVLLLWRQISSNLVP